MASITSGAELRRGEQFGDVFPVHPLVAHQFVDERTDGGIVHVHGARRERRAQGGQKEVFAQHGLN